MPKKRTRVEVQCAHFTWRLFTRNGVYFADGRAHKHRPGKRSLGTRDEAEARRLLVELDRLKAEACDLVPRRSEPSVALAARLTLIEGRRLYEENYNRPSILGGTRPATQKRYRTIFDKFLNHCSQRGVTSWDEVNKGVLESYASRLSSTHAPKTVFIELTVLKQTVRWLLQEGHLRAGEPIRLPMRKPQSRPAYCWRKEEVDAILAHCRSTAGLGWLHNVVLALATTGLRIAELAGLRWTDINLEATKLSLTDEGGLRPGIGGAERRRLKSGRSRSLPIEKNLLEMLQGLPKRNGLVFLGPRGGKINPDTVRRVLVRDVLEPLSASFPTPDGGHGFSDGRLHSFRHYFCSTCANSGVPELMLMKWLGHADSVMVQNYYHLQDADACRQIGEVNFVTATVVGEPSTGDEAVSTSTEEAPKPARNGG